MVDGDTYVKYNPEKTIKYLKYKVAKLNQCLKANSIQVTDSFVKVAGLDGKQENASEGKSVLISECELDAIVARFFVDHRVQCIVVTGPRSSRYAV